MKRTSFLIAGVVGLLFAAMAVRAYAAEEAKGKEMTITGEAKCAKCAMHETDKCQTVIQAEKDGKTVTYYLTANDVSKEFHENVCKDAKKATATGTVATVGGKEMLTASKIELAK